MAEYATSIEIDAEPTASGTRVDLIHSGLPDAQLEGHADGWTHFLARLRIAALVGDAGEDHWAPIGDRIIDENPQRSTS